jgi:hypothetical protein
MAPFTGRMASISHKNAANGRPMRKKKKKWKCPRPFSLVRFIGQYSPEDMERYYKPLIGKHFLFFGSIPNQPDHCILWTVGPQPTLVGDPEFFRHTVDFEEIPEDEL